jgi:hypothetical protein
MKYVFLELNEINFEYVSQYVQRGHLPNFKKLLTKYPLIRTTSEQKYENLEPWIQWVSIHTGLTFEEHKIFRLGDGATAEFSQIWNELESRGYSVAAISPMNAISNLNSAKFYCPDPWTDGRTEGAWLLQKLHRAVKQAVNSNAEERIELSSMFWLAISLLHYSSAKSLSLQFGYIFRAIKRKWYRAIVLDRLLADVFHYYQRKTSPDFSSLFLNAGAHVQHHYLFNSSVVEQVNRNPEWYVRPEYDPVLDVYSAYDAVLEDYLERPNVGLIVATGLRQCPCPDPVFYWRLKDHGQFLNNLGIKFTAVLPRMSRDFEITFESMQESAEAAALLSSATDAKGKKVFEVDARGDNLFVTLIYSDEVVGGMAVQVGAGWIKDFSAYVVFVALKNGIHDGTGYYINTGRTATPQIHELPVTAIFDDILRIEF